VSQHRDCASLYGSGRESETQRGSEMPSDKILLQKMSAECEEASETQKGEKPIGAEGRSR
jgi:hypothetical protein